MHKLQHCLGERGKGVKIKADRVNCPKNFQLSSIVDLQLRRDFKESITSCLLS